MKTSNTEQMHVKASASSHIKIGVSACLLGAQVRFDGGHKRNRFVHDEMGGHFKLIPYCPELAIGMGVPRQPIRLVSKPGHIRAIGVRDKEMDVTEPLVSYACQVAASIHDLSGFVFKSKSPSCGLERVKIYNKNGMPESKGIGLFARELRKQHPLMPMEEEGRLNDMPIRENFIMRVYVFAEWKATKESGLNKQSLLDFHARHKYLLMAHDQKGYGKLGKMLSNLKENDIQMLGEEYITLLMGMLRNLASRKQHANVLQHIMGYLKKSLDSHDRAELVKTIHAYRRGLLPLIVPITILQQYFKKYPNSYIASQVYMEPHPAELCLRNTL